MLKPQDIVVLLKVHSLGSVWTYDQLAKSLKMSSSVVYGALQRCEKCHLYHVQRRKVLKGALEEFLVYGLKYVFPAQVGTLVRWIPTAHSAEPLKGLLMVSDNNAYVWPAGSGKVKGQEIKPLYQSVPKVVGNDSLFYELLCLVDGLRVGKVRDRELTAVELKKRLYE
ncbi:MAG: hypothetical protein F6K47_30255 [Symploca sp. SIO2E6]|nr:hypothetical protein [Symploca sp. SIO2E6]